MSRLSVSSDCLWSPKVTRKNERGDDYEHFIKATRLYCCFLIFSRYSVEDVTARFPRFAA